eukprot:scaffold99849_cov61-Attheya_sp.AAC.1
MAVYCVMGGGRRVHTNTYFSVLILFSILISSSSVLGFGVSNKLTISRIDGTQLSSTNANSANDPFSKPAGQKGKLLVLGGSGFLGQTVSRRAILEGYAVTSLSRRGKPPPSKKEEKSKDGGTTTAELLKAVDYRAGDARDKATIEAILQEGGYAGVIHCIGLLFDDTSGLGRFNRFVSGSGSIPDKESTYDDITRLTAFNAIDAAEAYSQSRNDNELLPFVFTSAAEAGWPNAPGGKFVENTLAPGWLKRYLVAKREVEAKLSTCSDLRTIIFRPSLIYSIDKLGSLPPVGAFFLGNKVGLPFVDRPVTVQALSCAMVRCISEPTVQGVQRYYDIDKLAQ